MSKVDSHVLAAWLDDTLQAARFKDYCPNASSAPAAPAWRWR